RLPRELARLLEPHLERLRRRSDYRAGPPWQLFRTGLAYASHRVVWADVARRIAAAVPPPDVVPLHTVYGIATRTGEDAPPLAEPPACLLRPGAQVPPALVAAASARPLRDLAPLAAPRAAWPPWLAPHQVPAAERLVAIMRRYRGALLADAVGLGKSYVALAVALALREPFALVVPAVLVPQWRALLAERGVAAPVLRHEALSVRTVRRS